MLSGGMLALWLWNWKLAIALTLASCVGTAIYLRQERRLSLKKIRQSRAWKHHRSLWIGLLSGTGVCVGTYGTLTILQGAGQPWLVAALIGQGVGTLGALGLLVWDKVHAGQGAIASDVGQTRSFQDWGMALTDSNPVVRLMAVQTMTRQVVAQEASHSINCHSSSPAQESTLPVADLLACFQLMRKSEAEPIVRQALESAIQRLKVCGQDALPLQPISSPRPATSRPATSKSAIPNLIRTREMVKMQKVSQQDLLEVDAY
jgi:hypothetical protein